MLNIGEVSAVVSDIGISAQEDYFSILFSSLNRAKIYVKVKPEYGVDFVMEKARQIMEEKGLLKNLNSIGAEIIFQRRTTTFERILQSAESDIAIKIAGKRVEKFSIDSSLAVAKQVVEKIKDVEGITDIKITPEPGSPQIKILFERKKVDKYGLRYSELVSEITGYLRGKIATYVNSFNERIPVKIVADKLEEKDVLTSLLNYAVRSSNPGLSVPVWSVVKIEKVRGLSEIYRENGNRVAVVLANAGGRNIISVSKEIGEKLKEVEIKNPDFSVKNWWQD